MAKIEAKGFEDVLAQLHKLEQGSETIMKRALYEGARVAADAVKAEMEALPVSNIRQKKKRVLNAVEKQGLIDGFGISKMAKDNGTITVKTGFNGYNAAGKANAMIARTHIKGNSFMRRNDFIGRAKRRCAAEATEAMRKEISNQIAAN